MTSRVIDIEIDDEDTLTATTRLNDGSSLDDTVTVDLLRHKGIREHVKALSKLILEYQDNAAELNCGECVGACCMMGAHEVIHLTENDAKRLAKHLDMKLKAFAKKYLRPVNSAQDFAYIFKMKTEKKAFGEACCPMLKVNAKGVGKCSVYDARPRTCHEFPAFNCSVFVPIKRNKGSIGR